MKHTCHAAGCAVAIPPQLLMCRRHWRMVPLPLQREVWRTYRPGQESDGRPSVEYMEARRAAIEAVATLEHSR